MKKNLIYCAAIALGALMCSCSNSQPQAEADTALRLLNHWDNLDGTVERGYAGHSIFWNRGFIDSTRITEYAEKNQAIGINGTVLNNVNASPKMLTAAYLDTTAVYANLMRPYGIKVYLSVNFATPMALGETETADPLDPKVAQWWKDKADEIYRLIPDFGGFLVKANSEGQPGPCDFGRSHAEGANMLAAALAPHKGVVIWRSFVYSPSDPDRAKQAYIEFAKLDGQFADNVIIQIKNGPIDFQPREPVSPLFYAMPNTRLMAEFQITQEYLGHSNHIAFLAPMWREFLDEVKAEGLVIKDFAGVSNIGLNGCGNRLAELNWAAFGVLAQEPDMDNETLAKSLIQFMFKGQSESCKADLVKMVLMSREAVVDYMMPLGLHHQFAWGHHYGPEPWCAIPGARPDWMPSYYARADEQGLGFDRTVATGSGATAQYPDSTAALYESLDSCPEKYLTWFHHVSWDYTRQWECCGETETLWQHLGRHFQRGVNGVREMQTIWQSHESVIINHGMWEDINARLETQYKDAIWWKDAMLLYFQTFSAQPWPSTAEPAVHKLEDLMKVQLGIDNYTCPSLELLDSKR